MRGKMYLNVVAVVEVLMLSSEDLADILGLLHVNPELGQRRWFAVDAASLGEELRASSRGGGTTHITIAEP